MTWEEFKEIVDREIGREGYNSDIEIHYIDCSYPDQKHFSTALNIHVGDEGLSVHN
jgi:hypothetical protein